MVTESGYRVVTGWLQGGYRVVTGWLQGGKGGNSGNRAVTEW